MLFSSFRRLICSVSLFRRAHCFVPAGSCPKASLHFQPKLEALEDRLLLNGPTTFSDGTFNNSAWTSFLFSPPVNGSSIPAPTGAFSTQQVQSGGNPGSYQQTTMDWDVVGNGISQGVYVGHLQNGAIYTPSTQGSIGTINYSCDTIQTSSPEGPGWFTQPLLYQNGSYYWSAGVLGYSPFWSSHSQPGLTAADFSLFSGTGPQHPDFSASGAPITFGYDSSSAGAFTGGGTVHDHIVAGLDNWSVTINPSAAKLAVGSVSTTDPSSVSVEYSVSNADSASFNIGIYRSATPTYNPSTAVNVGSINVTNANDLAIGTHTVTLSTDTGLPNDWLQPDPLHRYVLAVADANNLTGETDSAHNTASFHVYVIAAVVPGFGEVDPRNPPQWVRDMAGSLQSSSSNPAGFDDAIPFGWDSVFPNHEFLGKSGINLADRIKTESQTNPGFKNLQPNDVIDVTLISHSRGGELTAIAMQKLEWGVIPQLQHGYKELFLTLIQQPLGLVITPTQVITRIPTLGSFCSRRIPTLK